MLDLFDTITDVISTSVTSLKKFPASMQGLFFTQKTNQPVTPQQRGVTQQPAAQPIDVVAPRRAFKMLQSSGWVDVVKSFIIGPIGIFGSLFLALILGYGNGYLFTGFHEVNFLDPLNVVTYCGGYILEFIGVGLLYRASQAMQADEKKLFATTLLFGIVLMFISWLGQYLLLENEFVTGMVSFPDAAIEAMPIIGGVITGFGLHGHDAIFMVRAGAFHFGEIVCVFLIPVRKQDIAKTVAAHMQESIAQVQMDGAEAVQQIMGQTYGIAHTMMKAMTEQVTLQAQHNMENFLGVAPTVTTMIDSTPPVQPQQRASAVTQSPVQPAIHLVQPIPQATPIITAQGTRKRNVTPPTPVVAVQTPILLPDDLALSETPVDASNSMSQLQALEEDQGVPENVQLPLLDTNLEEAPVKITVPTSMKSSHEDVLTLDTLMKKWGWDIPGITRLIGNEEREDAKIAFTQFGYRAPGFKAKELQ